ncbi:MAG: hypothetical protein E6K08_10340 [Methanobacteriota archaeon]|nr:MAG: hypothetical protein E6K08_10340 [Euryarchaeota archaeon]
MTVGPDLTFNGNGDAFVAKVNAAGTALVYAGYIGGSSFEEAFGIAVDVAGNAYVAGTTASSEATFPVTVGPDTTYNGGANVFGADAFVAKVNAAGTALVYAGYVGGSGVDQALGIAVDVAGNAYVTGVTDSSETTFPVTVGPDLTYNGNLDAFVAKVNAAGTALLYAGYIGGSADEGGYGIAVDVAGNAYVTGFTSSSEATFPVTVGPGGCVRQPGPGRRRPLHGDRLRERPGPVHYEFQRPMRLHVPGAGPARRRRHHGLRRHRWRRHAGRRGADRRGGKDLGAARHHTLVRDHHHGRGMDHCKQRGQSQLRREREVVRERGDLGPTAIPRPRSGAADARAID